MDIILTLIPAALVFSIVALIVFRWSVNSDQYDDMEGEAHRILMDDEDMIPGRNTINQDAQKKAEKAASNTKESQ